MGLRQRWGRLLVLVALAEVRNPAIDGDDDSLIFFSLLLVLDRSTTSSLKPAPSSILYVGLGAPDVS